MREVRSRAPPPAGEAPLTIVRIDDHASLRHGRRPLLDRELNVLRVVENGLSNRRSGTQLHLSETTVKFHVRNIMRKFDATSRAEAVYQATKNGVDLTSADL